MGRTSPSRALQTARYCRPKRVLCAGFVGRLQRYPRKGRRHRAIRSAWRRDLWVDAARIGRPARTVGASPQPVPDTRAMRRHPPGPQKGFEYMIDALATFPRRVDIGATVSAQEPNARGARRCSSGRFIGNSHRTVVGMFAAQLIVKPSARCSATSMACQRGHGGRASGTPHHHGGGWHCAGVEDDGRTWSRSGVGGTRCCNQTSRTAPPREIALESGRELVERQFRQWGPGGPFETASARPCLQVLRRNNCAS